MAEKLTNKESQKKEGGQDTGKEDYVDKGEWPLFCLQQ